MKLLWGDVHNHCGISYGYGSLTNALAVAREQLDFCAVTGHATWHDMPERTPQTAFVVDFHRRGFAKLAAAWDSIRAEVAQANVPGEFVTFQSYEAHSSAFGDYVILSSDDSLPIKLASSPRELVASLSPREVIAIPHHIAYVPGYRGINWSAFSSDISPVVEVYSKHGCGMSDTSPYPYLHDMGPRDSRNTVRAGLSQGHRFGFVASTDHHAGYPGSYGDGRMAVLATAKTRQAIWEGIFARRTYAVTGDKIVCCFTVNGAPMGSDLEASRREVSLSIRASDAIDRIVVYKNGKPWQVICGETFVVSARRQPVKIRIEMGWGKSECYDWRGQARIRDGEILSVETCFRGRSVLAPSPDHPDDPDINKLDNRVLQRASDSLAWRCTTCRNVSTLHPQTAAIVLEVLGDEKARLTVDVKGHEFRASLAEMLQGSRGVHMERHNSEAFLVHRAVPQDLYTFEGQWEDVPTAGGTDVYDVAIRERNGQCAWLSPIFVGS